MSSNPEAASKYAAQKKQLEEQAMSAIKSWN